MEESVSLIGQLKKEFDCKEVDVRTYSPLALAYIGDSIYDIQCATSAGVDSGLVLWSGTSPDSIKANYYFKTPDDICRMLSDFHPT